MEIGAEKTPSTPFVAQEVDFREFLEADLSTPAFVYDVEAVRSNAQILVALSERTSISFTYSIKACAVDQLLKVLLPLVSGFSVSSVFEARLSREVIEESSVAKCVHFTSPVFNGSSCSEIVELCDYVSFNSFKQAFCFAPQIKHRISCGLRINPGLSYVADERCDPCRQYSKLGAPIEKVAEVWRQQSKNFDPISGLHFHTNNASANFEQLFRTVEMVRESLPDLLQQITWLNMGGGYLFEDSDGSLAWFDGIRQLLGDNQPLALFMEPGEFLVGRAGYLASRVVDIFENAGKEIAILDTSINHLPECFEYQFEPDVLNTVEESEFEYILAGASCLSGDLFGVYCFPEKLAVGDMVVFSNVGAYSVVKANIFTGIPLPSIYVREANGGFTLQKKYNYTLYRQLWRKH